jgi:ketosteroid isomerase-like protein
MAGLKKLEAEGDAGELLDLFGESSRVSNVQLEKPLECTEGARRFWHDYRHTFDNIESRFTRITEAGEVAVLEWVSAGKLKTGRAIDYKGVSILTLKDGSISDFMAYFDSHVFTAHL